MEGRTGFMQARHGPAVGSPATRTIGEWRQTMPSDMGGPSDAVIRDQNASRGDTAAPPGVVENAHMSPRPPFHAEEGEADHSDWWSLLKAILIGVGLLMLLGWLLAM
jgi:hypothetical protein